MTFKKGHKPWNIGTKGVSKGHKKGTPTWNKGLTKEKDSRLDYGLSKEKSPRWGIKPWSYIDGRSKILSPARYGDDWDAIRLLVYKRDNYECQECGITMNEYGRGLDIHHKVPFLESKDNSMDNLITLCRKCHATIERQIKQKIIIRVD